ncbi:MAG: zinc ribbon domain-containing protein [Thermoplasmata archaeon]|nr:zinc ribbon domain-containing protein [Thermoplasmata archaeon]
MVTTANEASASLRSWDRWLRRMKRLDPPRWARLHDRIPRRRAVKASLHRDLYRLRGRVLDLTLHRDRHLQIDLGFVQNPLFERYGTASNWTFGLAVTDRALIFQFRIPQAQPVVAESAGVDLNMPSADLATSDGHTWSVDLRPITAVQGAMARKRAAIARHISKDLRHQRAVLRRYRRRERNRVRPLLHAAGNELLRQVGARNVVFEDLSSTSEECQKLTRRGDPDARRRLSAWTHGELQRIVRYKSTTAVVRANARGTSSECPNCGGPLAHPSWRRATCGHCQGDWHRDRAAALVILGRGHHLLRGAAPPPSARNELLEAARWRPDDDRSPGLVGEPMKRDDAKASGQG